MSTTTPAIGTAQEAARGHTFVDDLQAGATAIVLVSLGIALLGNAGLLTGGAPGLAFLLSYATGLPLGAALVAVNVPFYVLGWRQLGVRFVLKTCLAMVGLAAGVEVVRRWTALQAPAGYAAVTGGLLIGVGLLMMFRHRVSFGGVNILALHLNERLGWPVGKVQLAVDIVVLAAAFAVVDAQRVAWSVLAAVAVNAVLIWNHRPGRYLAT